MKRIALVLSCLLGSIPVFAAEPAHVEAMETTGRYSIVSKPPRGPLLRAYYASGLSGARGSVVIAFDGNGQVQGVKFDRSTGSALLDDAMMAWAAQMKLKVTSPGFGTMPFVFP